MDTRTHTHTVTKSLLHSCFPPQTTHHGPFELPKLLLHGHDPALQGLSLLIAVSGERASWQVDKATGQSLLEQRDFCAVVWCRCEPVT